MVRQIAVAGLAGILLTLAPAAADVRALTDAQWQADIEQMSAAIKDIHFKPFHNVTESSFDASVGALLNSLPQKSDKEIIIAMAEIVAALGDGHTRVHIPRVYPEFALEAELGHGGTPPPNESSLKLPR